MHLHRILSPFKSDSIFFQSLQLFWLNGRQVWIPVFQTGLAMRAAMLPKDAAFYPQICPAIGFYQTTKVPQNQLFVTAIKAGTIF